MQDNVNRPVSARIFGCVQRRQLVAIGLTSEIGVIYHQ